MSEAFTQTVHSGGQHALNRVRDLQLIDGTVTDVPIARLHKIPSIEKISHDFLDEKRISSGLLHDLLLKRWVQRQPT
jgi:hypothetical protein